MRRENGFTLIEVLIGMVLSVIVLGSIAFGVKSGITLFSKGNASSVVINDTRTVVDSFNRRISPLLAVTKSLDIVNVGDSSEIPLASSLTSSDHYVFLNDSGQLIHRTKSGDVTLLGSGHVVSLDFSIPVSSADNAGNYMLTVTLTTRYKEQETATQSAVLTKALFNKPEKSGNNAVSGSYKGNALHITCTNYLRILNGETGASAANTTLTKNTLLTADYAVYDTDESIRWLVAASSSDATVVVDTKAAEGYMAITTASGDMIEDDFLHPMPSDDIYVKTSSGHEKYSKNTYYIRYAVGSNWSPWVKIAKNTNTRMFGEDGVTQDIKNYFDEFGVNSKGQTIRNIDSEALKDNTVTNVVDNENFVANLKTLKNIDLISMGAVSWAYINSGGSFFYWTPVEVSPLAAGVEVPVIRFNFKSGTYTVWIATVTRTATNNKTNKKFTTDYGMLPTETKDYAAY
ncbi:MAG: prepilin-type N-terminal cleavage/methylation domain-containing protein, partial [Synergistaceae bacterium]|nr:prepilin-type N-terminal cleavage/methylation domain-containing protein [Synergistaceae bacterium]